MAEGLNTISVNIYGHRYHVKGTEEKEHLQMVAALVDSKMKEVNLRNPGLNMVCLLYTSRCV